MNNDLFIYQTDLIDMKVNMAVSNAIDRVVEQIRDLRTEMHDEMHNLRNEMNVEIHSLKSEMNVRFSSLENRMIAVETKLGIVNEKQREVRAKFVDYSFKAGWLILGIIISTAIVHLRL